MCAHAEVGVQAQVGFHLEALYLFWCASIPEPLDLRGAVCIFSQGLYLYQRF